MLKTMMEMLSSNLSLLLIPAMSLISISIISCQSSVDWRRHGWRGQCWRGCKEYFPFFLPSYNTLPMWVSLWNKSLFYLRHKDRYWRFWWKHWWRYLVKHQTSGVTGERLAPVALLFGYIWRYLISQIFVIGDIRYRRYLISEISGATGAWARFAPALLLGGSSLHCSN